MASHFKILPITVQEIEKSFDEIVRIWLTEEPMQTDAERGVDAVREFILRHQESRFKNVRTPGSAVIHNVAGYWDPIRDVFVFLDTGFKEACAGHNAKDVATYLDKQRMLFVTDSGHLKSKHSIDGRRIRAYAVRAAILGERDE